MNKTHYIQITDELAQYSEARVNYYSYIEDEDRRSSREGEAYFCDTDYEYDVRDRIETQGRILLERFQALFQHQNVVYPTLQHKLDRLELGELDWLDVVYYANKLSDAMWNEYKRIQACEHVQNQEAA